MVAVSEEVGGIDVLRTVRALMSGELRLDADTVEQWLKSLAHRLTGNLFGLLPGLVPPMVVGLVVRILLGLQRGVENGALLLCRLSCVGVLLSAFAVQREAARRLLEVTVRVVNGVSPALIAAATLTGANTAAILSPMTALCAGAIENLLAGAGLALCSLAAAVAASANLSMSFRLRRLFRLVKGVTVWAIGLLMAAFTGLMALEGLLGASQDAAALRGARYVLQNVLPIIGGEIASAADGLAGSAVAVRNAVGVTGMLLLLSACARPLAELAATALSMKLAAAILEPAADRCMTDAAAQFGETADMLLAIGAGGAALALLTMGAFLCAAGNLLR